MHEWVQKSSGPPHGYIYNWKSPKMLSADGWPNQSDTNCLKFISFLAIILQMQNTISDCSTSQLSSCNVQYNTIKSENSYTVALQVTSFHIQKILTPSITDPLTTYTFSFISPLTNAASSIWIRSTENLDGLILHRTISIWQMIFIMQNIYIYIQLGASISLFDFKERIY